MPDAAWKHFEREIALRIGGKRRGPDVRGDSGGKNDIIHPHWSAEVKLLGSPGYAALLDACKQAEANAEKFQCPVAFVKRKSKRVSDTLVIMRLPVWLDWYGPEKNES